MRNDLTKTMDMTISPETYQKVVLLRKYIFEVWPGEMRVALGIRRPCRMASAGVSNPNHKSEIANLKSADL